MLRCDPRWTLRCVRLAYPLENRLRLEFPFRRIQGHSPFRIRVGTLYSQPPRVRNVRQFLLSLTGRSVCGMSLDVPADENTVSHSAQFVQGKNIHSATR